MVRRFGQWMTGALVVWALMLTFAWFTSDGEPVCEGPLINSSDDSDPPQCPSPIEGLLEVGPVLLGLLVVFAWLGFLVTTGLAQRRRRSDITSVDDS